MAFVRRAIVIAGAARRVHENRALASCTGSTWRRGTIAERSAVVVRALLLFVSS